MTKHKLIQISFMVAGLYVAFQGVREFDNANTTIEFIRGLFWILVGITCLVLAKNDYKKGDD